MAVLTKAAFLSKYATIFADNTSRDISEEDMRDFREDIADSFALLTDVGGASGAFVPTLTNGANVASSSLGVFQYMQMGTVVTVSGSVQITPTAGASANTELFVSLPVASDFANTGQCAGAGYGETSGSNQAIAVSGDASNNRAKIVFAAQGTGTIVYKFTFTYLIV